MLGGEIESFASFLVKYLYKINTIYSSGFCVLL